MLRTQPDDCTSPPPRNRFTDSLVLRPNDKLPMEGRTRGPGGSTSTQYQHYRPTKAIHDRVEQLGNAGVEFTADLAEGGVEVTCQCVHARDCGEANESSHQRVLDQVLTLFVFDEFVPECSHLNPFPEIC